MASSSMIDKKSSSRTTEHTVLKSLIMKESTSGKLVEKVINTFYFLTASYKDTDILMICCCFILVDVEIVIELAV